MALCLQKNRSSELYLFHSFQREQRPLFFSSKVHIDNKRIGMKCSREVWRVFFFKIRVFKIFIASESWKVLWYMIFFKSLINSKMKMKYEKTLHFFCRTKNSPSIDLNIESIGRTIHPLVYLPRTIVFLFSLKNSFYMKKKTAKSTRQLSQLFLDFHYDQTTNNEIKIKVRSF